MAKWFAKNFYQSKQWLSVRELKLTTVNRLCEKCLDKGIIKAAVEVHHKIHLNDKNIHDPNIAFSQDNLIALCRFCHKKEHGLQTAIADGLYFDTNGQIMSEQMNESTKQSINVNIVWGCYGSGKTTYVKQHMQHGDLVIDLDLIGQAISMCDKTDVPNNLLYTSIKLRDYLYQLIEARDVNANCVWVIGGLPTKQEREALQQRLNAILIHIDTSKEECIRRVMADNERKNKQIQVEIIEKWFKMYDVNV